MRLFIDYVNRVPLNWGKEDGEGHGHGHGHGHDEPFYLHAKHMYNLDRMKYQKVQVPLAVLGVVCRCWSAYFAVVYQQSKTASA
ncbi:hypothetical protein AAG906_012199 [Vitis piasezkii]